MENSQDIKQDAGKLRYDLIPPECMRALAEVYTFGTQKYEEDSWKEVEPKRYQAALLRHVYQSLEGEKINKEDGGVRVLAQVAWNAFSLLWLELHKEHLA